MKAKFFCILLLGSLVVYGGKQVYAENPTKMIEKLKGQVVPLEYFWESSTFEMLAHSPKQPNFSPFSLTEFLIDTSIYYTTLGAQRYPAIAFDGTNFMAVWMDSRGVVGARISTDGTILDTPAFLISSYASADLPDIVFDGTNYFVAWLAGNTGADIYGARITPDGTVLDPNGFSITTNGDYNVGVAYGDGVYLVTWGVHVAMAALVDTNGTVLSSFLIRGDYPNESDCHPHAAFNGTNFLVVWSIAVYHSPPPWECGIMGSRITPNGTNLDPGGFHITYQTGNGDATPQVVFDGTNWFVVFTRMNLSYLGYAWVTPDGVPFGEADIPGGWGLVFPEVVLGDSVYWVEAIDITDPNIYAARIDFQGNVLDNPWIPVDMSPGWQAYGGDAYGDSTFIAIWEDQVNWDIYARRYAPDGNPLDSTRFLVNSSINSQRYPPGVAFDGTNYLAVYVDDRNNDNYIYGARVTQNGIILDAEGFPISSQGTGGVMYPWPRVAFGDSLYLCVWENSDAQIWGARILPDGTVLDPNGLPITSGYYESSWPSISYSHGIFLVSYRRYNGNYQYAIKATRVALDGQILDPAGIIIKPPEVISRPVPEVAPYDNGFLVTWLYKSASDSVIEGARLNFQGAVLDSPAIQISPPGVGGEWHGVASSGDTFFVVWDRDTTGIYGTRVDSSGAVLDPAGIAVCINQPNRQAQPSVAFNGKDFLVVWQDSRLDPSQYDLFGARVSPDGVVLDTNGVELINAAYSRANVELTSATPDPDTGAQMLLVFDGFVGDPYNNNRALGAVYYPPTGIEEGYTKEISTGYRINISPNISCRKPYVLSYSLPARTEIGVNVYDITGRLVKNIYNGNIERAGEMKFSLDGTAQGVYFVRVETKNRTEKTKIIWLK